jgi:dimethylhistidine N-methyltransferase
MMALGTEVREATCAPERLEDAGESVLRTALGGLLATPRQLPPKLFYDACGARLFEEITRLDEYYLTRIERSLLGAHSHAIAHAAGSGRVLIEYGSGAAEKVRLLLDALTPAAYVPVDVSGEQLDAVAIALATDHPNLEVYPVAADFTTLTELPPSVPAGRRIGLLLGSTIGNLHPAGARAFLRRAAEQLGPDGALVLGVDLRKAPAVLHAAYNDPAGVTARFNRNVLHRLQRECGARVDVNAFAHYAYYNPVAGRVEMHLVATMGTEIHLAGHVFRFAAGEGIWTESSYKYTTAELEWLARDSGFHIARLWTDAQEWFAVAVLEPAGAQ